MNPEVIEKLKIRYQDLHPLLFHRSLERAKSEVALFDILHSTPTNFPLAWDEQKNCWAKIELFPKSMNLERK